MFLVRDQKAPPPGRLLALKILLPSLASNEDFLRMFFAEAKLASMLRHENIVGIAGFGQVDGIHCLAMEYVFGASLAQVLRASARAKKPLTVGVLLRITAAVCDALHYAHELHDEEGKPMGVVHRDVTPQNILIGFNGIPKLTDFGIAKATNRGWETQAGIVKGKFSYMSPEQALGKRVDRRSDIFGTGIVLWEALTGRDLFKGSTPMEVLTNIREQKIEPPSKVVDGLTPIVDPIVMKALRRSPKQRYQTAEEMREDIEDLIRRAGVAIDAQTISREFAAIYGDEIVERAFALRAAMAGKPDLEDLAKVLGGALLNPKHLPTMIPGGVTDPDPLGLFSEEGPRPIPESDPLNGAMPARSDLSDSNPAPLADFDIDVDVEEQISQEDLKEMEAESFGPEHSPIVPQNRAISGWDDSTAMAIKDDELLSMISEEDATIGYLPPAFADRFGAELKRALEEGDDEVNFDDEATVGISDHQLAQLRAAKDESALPWERVHSQSPSSIRSMRPIPRAPSLDMDREDRPVPRAPSLDMDAMTPIPDLEDARPPPSPPPPPPRAISSPIEDEQTGPSMPPLQPHIPDLDPLVPKGEDEPLEPSMPGESVLQGPDLESPSEVVIDEGTIDDNASTALETSAHGANLDDSVLLEAGNPLSPDDLRALAAEASDPGETPPPPHVLPPPPQSTPSFAPSQPGIGPPISGQEGSDQFGPGSFPVKSKGIQLTPFTFVMMILGLVGAGVGIGLLLAN